MEGNWGMATMIVRGIASGKTAEANYINRDDWS
jgi:hypothetical protein